MAVAEWKSLCTGGSPIQAWETGEWRREFWFGRKENSPAASTSGLSGPICTHPAQTWTKYIVHSIVYIVYSVQYIVSMFPLFTSWTWTSISTFWGNKLWLFKTFQLSPRSHQIHTCSDLGRRREDHSRSNNTNFHYLARDEKNKLCSPKAQSRFIIWLPITQALCPSLSPGMSPNTEVRGKWDLKNQTDNEWDERLRT